MITVGDTFIPLIEHEVRRQCIETKCPYVLIEGPRGTGKTFAILCYLLRLALEWPGIRILICRSSRSRLTQSVMVTLEKLVFPAFGMATPGAAGRDNRSEYVLPNGSVLVLAGMDDQQRTTSAEYAVVYVSEGIEIAERDDVQALSGALRLVVDRVNDDGTVERFVGHHIVIDCNPGSPHHWLNAAAEPMPKGFGIVRTPEDYDRIVEHNAKPTKPGFWKRMFTRHQCNPAYWDAEQWGYTPEGSAYVEGVLSNLSGHLRRRWLDGDWVAAEGTVYPEFDEERHVVDAFEVPDDWPQYVGIDPGYDHPCAILWFAISPNETLYVVDELYLGGKGVDVLSEMIHARNANRTVRRYFGDPQHAFNETAQSPVSIAGQFARNKIHVDPWPRSIDVEAMVSEVRTRLNADLLKVFRTCPHTIGEFQSWRYKRMADGSVPKGDDAFEDANNHAMDVVKGVNALCLKYGSAGVEAVQTSRVQVRRSKRAKDERMTDLDRLLQMRGVSR